MNEDSNETTRQRLTDEMRHIASRANSVTLQDLLRAFADSMELMTQQSKVITELTEENQRLKLLLKNEREDF